MKFVIAPQNFKGSASAIEVARSMSKAVRQVFPHAQIVSLPLADGGTGTVETLVEATGGRIFTAATTDPLGRAVTGQWGVLGDGETAIVEVASASGLSRLGPAERNPLVTTTYGTGQLILAAMEAGYRHILIGLGDSGTNDAGAGLASCLGIRCLDRSGQELPPGGASLINLHSVDPNGIHPALASSTLTALYDVTNPLCGANGASFTYGPQKGATPEQAQLLDAALENFASVLETIYARDIRNLQGAGAAGGLGGGLAGFFGAILRSGFDVISGILNLAKAFENADVLLTGEGQVDSQSAAGKTVGGISLLAKRCSVPSVIAITGRNLLDRNEATATGIDAIFPLFEDSSKNTNTYINTTRSIEETTIRSLQEFLLR